MSIGKLKIKTKIISKFEMLNVSYYRVLENVHCWICIFPEYVTYHRFRVESLFWLKDVIIFMQLDAFKW